MTQTELERSYRKFYSIILISAHPNPAIPKRDCFGCACAHVFRWNTWLVYTPLSGLALRGLTHKLQAKHSCQYNSLIVIELSIANKNRTFRSVDLHKAELVLHPIQHAEFPAVYAVYLPAMDSDSYNSSKQL